MDDWWNDIDWADIAVKAGLAILVLLVTWIVAKLVKMLFTKLAAKVPALRRAGSDGESLGSTLGSVGALIVWLFGLVAVLQVLGLRNVLAPVQRMLENLMSYIPNIIGAAVVFLVGALLAKVVRQLVETALSALPFEKWFHTADARTSRATNTPETTRSASNLTPMIARTAATVLYALIMIVVTIAALQILGIESISRPAETMLQTIFDAIPNLIAAALVLGIGVLIARFAGDIVRQLLDGFGVDRQLREADVLPEGSASASSVIAKLVQIAIVLFFAVMAADLLGFPQIERFLSEVLALGGRVLFGAAIIAAGFFIANLLSRMFSGTGATIVRYATIVLFVAMGLKSMGIADSIINLGFGALVVGAAAAAALAFGLGGRETAARQLKKLESKAESSAGSSPADKA